MRDLKLVAMLAAASVGSSASAQIVYSAPVSAPRAYDRIELQQIYQYRLRNLRQEALRLQARDGGELSAQSRTALQAKLDRINATRVRDARRNDLLSVDALGTPQRPIG